MNDKQLRKCIEDLPDGAFIDLLDGIMGIKYASTATEWLEQEYRTGTRDIRKMFEDLQDYRD